MRQLKSLAKAAIRRAGYDIVQYYPECARPLDVLPLLVAHDVASGGCPFVLQVGANDGRLADPVHSLIRRYGLPGILIEPVPELFRSLRDTYADIPNIALENCAVSWTNGTQAMYRVKAGAPVPDWARGLASFDRGHLVRERGKVPNIEKHIERIDVTTSTIAAILERNGEPSVDLLQIDVEGFDLEVLRMAMEGGLRPRFIQYENCHLGPKGHSQAHHLLKESGYRFVDVGMDTVATLEP